MFDWISYIHPGIGMALLVILLADCFVNHITKKNYDFEEYIKMVMATVFVFSIEFAWLVFLWKILM